MANRSRPRLRRLGIRVRRVVAVSAAYAALYLTGAGELRAAVIPGTENLDVRGITISDGHAYVSVTSGLLVLELSDPAQPTVLSLLPLGLPRPGQIVGHYRIRLRDSLAFVPMYGGGVYVVNVADPANPQVAYHIPTTHNIREVALNGNFMYAGTNDTGLLVYDISELSAPVLLGITSQTDLVVRDIEILGPYALVLAFRLYTFDLSDPAAPELVNINVDAGRGSGMRVRGDLAYVTDESAIGTTTFAGLGIFDIGQPDSALYLGGLELHFGDADVHIAGQVAYVLSDHLQPHAVDISLPDTPTFMAWLSGSEGSPSSIAGYQDQIYIGTRLAGALVLALERRGDCNADALVTSADVIWLVNHVFKGGPAPQPPSQGNTDCVGGLTSADAIRLVNYIFKGADIPACP